jgi:hypothetical protein
MDSYYLSLINTQKIFQIKFGFDGMHTLSCDTLFFTAGRFEIIMTKFGFSPKFLLLPFVQGTYQFKPTPIYFLLCIYLPVFYNIFVTVNFMEFFKHNLSCHSLLHILFYILV